VQANPRRTRARRARKNGCPQPRATHPATPRKARAERMPMAQNPPRRRQQQAARTKVRPIRRRNIRLLPRWIRQRPRTNHRLRQEQLASIRQPARWIALHRRKNRRSPLPSSKSKSRLLKGTTQSVGRCSCENGSTARQTSPLRFDRSAQESCATLRRSQRLRAGAGRGSDWPKSGPRAPRRIDEDWRRGRDSNPR
jgi:hypothetical protein